MSGSTPTPTSTRRPLTNPSTPSPASQTTPARSSTLKSKTGAPPSAKAAAKRSTAKDDDDARAETAALIEDLKEQLRKTESASDEYQKQLSVAQSRLDEALAEQTKLEETSNQHAQTIVGLEARIREVSRQKADLETQREADEAVWVSERDMASTRESELQAIIQRLKENLSQREQRRDYEAEDRLSRSTSTIERPSPSAEASGPVTSDDSQTETELSIQKDDIIEGLRLELAEAQIKMMEIDRAGGGRLQELEKNLLEARMTNAKLVEDNESYQFLLQERTLNGDFANRFRATTPSSAVSHELGSSTLADELETASDATELEAAKERRKLEKAKEEIVSLEDQNKAMKLYIDKIIGKLLASDHYEAVLGGSSVAAANTPLANTQSKPRQSSMNEGEAGKENAASSLLQRAGSIFGGARNRPSGLRGHLTALGQATGLTESAPPEEEQQRLAAKVPPTAHEDPTTAPSVPLSVRNSMASARAHRRSNSDWTASTPSYTTSAPNRPSTPTNSTPRQSSSLSTSSPPAAQGGVILQDNDPATSSETATSSSEPDTAVLSETTTDSLNVLSVSPPRSLGGSSADGAGGRSGSSGGAATVSGKQMRPLRLVQEKAEADAERKRQNRGSWVGWFNRGVQPTQMDGAPGSRGSGA